MFSSAYFSQFGSDLWTEARNSLDGVSWSFKGLFDRLAWILALQILLFIGIVATIYSNRLTLRESSRWSVLAARPLSAAFFISIFMTMWFFEYQGAPIVWQLANIFVIAFSVGRLLGGLTKTRWKKQFIWGMLSAFIAARFLYFLDLPLPLLRLCTAVIALLLSLLLFNWASQSRSVKKSWLYTSILLFGAVVFLFIFFAEVSGKDGLGEHLFLASLRSVAIILAFLLLMRMTQGVFEYGLQRLLGERVKSRRANVNVLIDRAALFFSISALSVVIVPAILMIWGAYRYREAISGFFTLGLTVGAQEFTVGVTLLAGGILFGTFLISSLLQELLVEKVLIKRRMETGVRISIARLVHYILLFISALVIVWLFGFQFTKLVIVLSALGVGIGFGLQSIVNNFISGIILLFERPIRVGDALEFEGQWVVVEHIGLRATTVQTLDQADVIIPNADLVTNPVTNWTLSDRQVRLKIPVGVAYGSDIPLVIKTLYSCGAEHEKIVKTPAPQVAFLEFGDSSLNFELRAWVVNADERLMVRSDLLLAIERKFREAKIEISFPQRDLHIRSVDEKVVLK